MCMQTISCLSRGIRTFANLAMARAVKRTYVVSARSVLCLYSLQLPTTQTLGDCDNCLLKAERRVQVVTALKSMNDDLAIDVRPLFAACAFPPASFRLSALLLLSRASSTTHAVARVAAVIQAQCHSRGVCTPPHACWLLRRPKGAKVLQGDAAVVHMASMIGIKDRISASVSLHLSCCTTAVSCMMLQASTLA